MGQDCKSYIEKRGCGNAVPFLHTVLFARRPLMAIAWLITISFLLISCAGYASQPQPLLALSATSLDFSGVLVGQSGTQTLHIMNGGTGPLQIVSLSLANGEFSFSGPSVPRVILPSMSVDYVLTFAPTSAGSASASLKITTNAGNTPTTISLTGVGEKSFVALQFSPASINFGNLNVSATNTQNVSLRNTGDVNITIKGVTVIGAGFGYSDLSPGFSLSPNQQVTFQVWFKPLVKGPAAGKLSVLSSNLATPVSLAVSGDGVLSTSSPSPSSIQHTVHLSWNPSTSSVAGYLVYRGEISDGPYSMLTPGAQSSLSFDDATVSSGSTYYYVVTAVNTSGEESIHSNQVSVAVPNP